MRGRFAGHLAVVVAGAVAVRVAYTLAVAADIPTIGDAETYHLLGAHLAGGHGYVRPHELAATGAEIPTAEFPPLFPGLLAAADLAGADTVLAQKLLLALLGGATVALVGLLGRAVAGPPVGLTAAGVVALHPALFGAEGALMAEALYVPLVAAALLLSSRARSAPARGTWLALGLALGAAALTRAEALLLVPLVVVPLAAGTRSLPGIARAWRGGYAVLGVLLVVAPWTVRNAVVLDDFVPVSNNLGGLVVGANCPPTYAGDFKGLWLFECYGRVDAAGLDESRRADAYLESGIDYARDNAGELPGVVAVRLLRTWGLWDPSGQVAWETLEGRDRTWQTVAHRVHLVLLPAAAAGVVVAHRRRLLQWPLLSTLAVACVVPVLAYGNQRFRAAAEPAIAVLAAIATVAAARAAAGRLRSGRAGRAS